MIPLTNFNPLEDISCRPDHPADLILLLFRRLLSFRLSSMEG